MDTGKVVIRPKMLWAEWGYISGHYMKRWISEERGCKMIGEAGSIFSGGRRLPGGRKEDVKHLLPDCSSESIYEEELPILIVRAINDRNHCN
jgi:hypothetical protein